MSARQAHTSHAEQYLPTIRLLSEKLPEKAVVFLASAALLQPEWFKLPDGKRKKGGGKTVCPYTGMSRTWVEDRVRLSQGTRWPIKARHIRERGNTRGVVLIDRASYLAYLEHQAPPKWALPFEEIEGVDGEGI